MTDLERLALEALAAWRSGDNLALACVFARMEKHERSRKDPNAYRLERRRKWAAIAEANARLT